MAPSRAFVVVAEGGGAAVDVVAAAEVTVEVVVDFVAVAFAVTGAALPDATLLDATLLDATLLDAALLDAALLDAALLDAALLDAAEVFASAALAGNAEAGSGEGICEDSAATVVAHVNMLTAISAITAWIDTSAGTDNLLCAKLTIGHPSYVAVQHHAADNLSNMRR